MDQKNAIAQFLLQHQSNGHILRGAEVEAAKSFGLSTRTIRRIWAAVKQQQSIGQPVIFKKKGTPHIDKIQIDEEKVMSLSVLERSSIRKMASKLQVSKSLLGKWIKEKKLKPHTNAIRPTVSEANKLARLKFSLSQLRVHNDGDKFYFHSMHNTIHIDEKWFYMTKTTDRYYLLPSEQEPYRSCQSKRFITKVMFMCAVSRPVFANDGTVIFDGKFGIFPFTTLQPAKRKSKNREKGTLETKPIHSITKEVIKECIISQIIPTIKAKWPASLSKEIIIQQDSAKPHINGDDPEFLEAANKDGFNIKLVCQPPNSPDTNVNDLGFFRAIQSLQDDKPTKNVEDLLLNVISSFEELSANTLNNVFLTLQGCLTEIMKVKGGNHYKIPHMSKARLNRLGILPECIEVDKELVRDIVDYLRLPENEAGSSYDIDPLMHYFGF